MAEVATFIFFPTDHLHSYDFKRLADLRMEVNLPRFLEDVTAPWSFDDLRLFILTLILVLRFNNNDKQKERFVKEERRRLVAAGITDKSTIEKHSEDLLSALSGVWEDREVGDLFRDLAESVGKILERE